MFQSRLKPKIADLKLSVLFQCIMGKAWFLRLSMFLLITYLIALCLKEKKLFWNGKVLKKSLIQFTSKYKHFDTVITEEVLPILTFKSVKEKVSMSIDIRVISSRSKTTV